MDGLTLLKIERADGLPALKQFFDPATQPITIKVSADGSVDVDNEAKTHVQGPVTITIGVKN